MAFGSLAVGFCDGIRWIMYYIDLVGLGKKHALSRFIMLSMHCLTWCIQKYFRSMIRSAHTRCAINHKPFYTSSRDAVKIMMRSFMRVSVLQITSTFLFLLAKVLVTIASGTVAYLVFANDSVEEMLEFVPASVFLVDIGLYYVAGIFFDVYEGAVITLTLCFCTYSAGMRLKQIKHEHLNGFFDFSGRLRK